MLRAPSYLLLSMFLACSGETASDPAEPASEAPVAKPAEPSKPLPSLLVAYSHFAKVDGKTTPQPAKLVIWRTDGENWWSHEILDPDSNVFHKAKPWRDGILTIGAMSAKLKHWTRDGESWKAEVLWERSWGGDFDRLRDIEMADLDGDGKKEIILATHDQGVVAVGTEGEAGWNFVEMDQTPDIFVHEIEVGDVDGDGTTEFYATPSLRNRSSGVSQKGRVVRYDRAEDGTWQASDVVSWPDTHAKEILVADVNGDGQDELYAVREAVTRKSGKTVKIVEPVQIIRYDRGEDGSWVGTEVARLTDRQSRFLLTANVDGDPEKELIAAGFKSGLWVLDPKPDGTFENKLVDAASGGFEHATHAADLDGDGVSELYVASDKQKELRVYRWNGEGWSKQAIAEIAPSHITWGIQDAEL